MPNYSQAIADLNAASHLHKHNAFSKWDWNEKKNKCPSCVRCGNEVMYKVKEIGNKVWWSCTTPGCIANQDTPRPNVANHEFIKDMNRIGNVSKLWKNMRPII
jgi:hypothetical protein